LAKLASHARLTGWHTGMTNLNFENLRMANFVQPHHWVGLVKVILFLYFIFGSESYEIWETRNFELNQVDRLGSPVRLV
jgi:hypothetical protein